MDLTNFSNVINLIIYFMIVPLLHQWNCRSICPIVIII